MDFVGNLNSVELRERVANIRQVGRIQRLVHEDGPARGSRPVRVVTGGGSSSNCTPTAASTSGRSPTAACRWPGLPRHRFTARRSPTTATSAGCRPSPAA